MESLAEGLTRLRNRRIGRFIAGVLSERLTPSGRALASMWVVAGVLGAASLNAPIYHVWAFATAALTIAAISSRVLLPALDVRRRPLGPTSVGEVLISEVEVHNRSRRVARDLTLHERDLPPHLHARSDPSGGVVRLGPGERRLLRTRLVCDKRGSYELSGPTVGSTYPLGLWRVLRRYPSAARFLVYPAFTTPTEFAIPEGRNHQPGGFLLSSNVGESSEFMNTRDYRTGDNPRHVHWSSTARLGRPIVKVYHEEYFVRMALVLDTEVGGGRSDAAFETGVSIAAGIADHLSRREYIIDLFAAGAEVYHFQAGRALAHFDHILEILACVDGSPTVDFAALAQSLVSEAPRLTGVVVVLMDWTSDREAVVWQLQALGVGVRVIIVRDGEPSDPKPLMPPGMLLHLQPGEALPDAEQAAARNA